MHIIEFHNIQNVRIIFFLLNYEYLDMINKNESFAPWYLNVYLLIWAINSIICSSVRHSYVNNWTISYYFKHFPRLFIKVVDKIST